MRSPDEITLTRDGRVALITIRRPQAMNALTGEVMDDLREMVHRVAHDPTVGCVVLTGAGQQAFCAGADVNYLAARNRDPAFAALDAHERQRITLRWMETPRLLHEMDKPTIAMIAGVAAGGGLGLALSCDLRVGTPATRLVTAFARMALPGDFGISYFLARLCPAQATELMLLPDALPAERAQALGLLHRLVPQDALEDTTLRLARQLADGPTSALGAIKRNLRAGASGDLAAALAREARLTYEHSRSNDHHEAARAFVEKRPARFHGDGGPPLHPPPPR